MPTTSEFIVRVGANFSGFERGINAGVSAVGRLMGSLRGTLAALGIGLTVKKIIDLGSEIEDMSRKMGISTDKFQEWKYAAEQAGTSVDSLALAFKRMETAQIQAIKKGGFTAEAFKRSGLGSDLGKGLEPDQVWEKVGRNFQHRTPSAQTTADAVTIFGRNGTEMLKLFRGGFLDAEKEARDLGLILDRNVTFQLKEAQKEMTKLKNIFFSAIAPMIAKATEWGEQLSIPMFRFLKQSSSIRSVIGEAKAQVKTADTVVSIASLLAPRAAAFAEGFAKSLYHSVQGNLSGDTLTEVQKAIQAGNAALEIQKAEQAAHPYVKKTPPAAPASNTPEDDNVQTAKNLNAFQAPTGDKLEALGLQRGGGTVVSIQSQQLRELVTVNSNLRQMLGGDSIQKQNTESVNKLIQLMINDHNDYE